SSRVSLFISMGKRQRLRPSELKSLMVERSGLPPESFGRVNVRENYAFIEVPVAQAAQILAAMEGAELNGRPLEIKPARKRSEQEQEGI
ncbi:MAG: DbpA RNA binding domain-containing protein, partial [Rectinema sp.]|nr:DbpA RNA binding domain-containing protein [Rectinema sp.]